MLPNTIATESLNPTLAKDSRGALWRLDDLRVGLDVSSLFGKDNRTAAARIRKRKRFGIVSLHGHAYFATFTR